MHGRTHDSLGLEGGRYHDWPIQDDDEAKDIQFEDIIIVSDEDIPAPQYNGVSYTLWTEAHVRNELYVGGQRSKYLLI